MRKIIPVGEWKPDDPDLGNTCPSATNVLPWKNSYKSFPTAVVYSSAITAAAQGGFATRDKSGNPYTFAGDATKLYQLTSGTAFTDVSRASGGAYTVASDDWVEFAQWGETVITVNGHTDVPQVLTLGGANFAALGGSPPKARHIGIVNNFVVLGNTNRGGTAYPNEVYWSAINNSADWTVAAATQCDYQQLQGDGGWVNKIVPIGANSGLVFQDRAVWRMDYIGSPEVFQFTLIDQARGAYCPQGVISSGNRAFFVAEDGFHMILGGAISQPIGDGKVDKYFLNDLVSLYSYRVQAAIDPVNKFVMWCYPGAGSTSGTPNKILVYNWAYNRWSLVNLTVEMLLKYSAVGYTLEQLDNINTSIDALGISLDSRVWMKGAMTIACFDSSHKLNTFTGSAMSPTVDTGEIELFPGRKAVVKNTMPITDSGTPSIAVGTRERQQDAVSFGSAVASNSFGWCPQRVNSRYQRYRITDSGSFSFIEGVLVDAEPGASR